MESTNISKYRIKLKWKVDDNGNKKAIYYPQYRSRLFGWRYMYEFLTDGDDSTLLPDMAIGMVMGSVVCGIGFLFGLVALFHGDFDIALLIPATIIIEWIIIWLNNRFSLDSSEVMKYPSKEGAKSYITQRINNIIKEEDKQKRTLKSRETLPDNEVFYLDIKSERRAKLKKIKRKSIFKI